jgi:hypothetical protein
MSPNRRSSTCSACPRTAISYRLRVSQNDAAITADAASLPALVEMARLATQQADGAAFLTR